MSVKRETLPDDGGWYVTDESASGPSRYERRDAARCTTKMHSGWVISNQKGMWERGPAGRVRVFKTFLTAVRTIERIEGI